MASSYSWATGGQTPPPALEESPPTTLQMQPSVPDAGQLPSPTDLSAAAAILATLSESRPPTSQGEEEEVLDDDQTGGISLEEDGQSFVIPHAQSINAAGSVGFGSLGEVIHSSTEAPFHDLTFGAYDSLDQHAAALESLSMEQPTSPLGTYGSLSMQEQFQALAPAIFHMAEPGNTAHDEAPSVPNPDAFLDIATFFQYHGAPTRAVLLGLDVVDVPTTITREDLNGDECDFQGIDWSKLKTSREAVRAKRRMHESGRIEMRSQQERQFHKPARNSDNFFSFRRMNTAHKAFAPHFQLRNLLATTSRNDIYYATRREVLHMDASGSPASIVLDLSKHMTEAQYFSVTTLAAANNVLIAGGFEGEYAIRDLSSTHGTPHVFDRIKDRYPDSKSHITNHIHLFDSRTTYTPQAVLCSNDFRLRILDCATNSFTHSFLYPTAVNCSATSPNGRMRVVVGDFQETLITNAETGKPFEMLNSHSEDVFACTWADDGIHVATAAQDSSIVVWDARYWGKPLAVLPSELSIPRSLRFSPVGSGPRVLIAGEADDYINIINAQTFETKQVFDFFGPIAGISITPDGRSLFVANSDNKFGGIIELERTDWAERNGNATATDWGYDWDMDEDRRVLCGGNERQRRGMNLSDLAV